MRSNAEMMKKFNEYAPSLTIFSIVGAGTIAFFAGQAVGEHDESQTSHPVIVSQIKDNSAMIDSHSKLWLAKFESQDKIWEAVQAKNESDHRNLAATQDRMIVILDRLEGKIDAM